LRLKQAQADAVEGELDLTGTCAIHFRSVANQARFVRTRQLLARTPSKDDVRKACTEIEEILHSEFGLARRADPVVLAP